MDFSKWSTAPQSNLPSSALGGYNFNNVQLSQNQNGGLSTPQTQPAAKPANPINYGYTTPKQSAPASQPEVKGASTQQSNPNADLISKYKAAGWNDEAAIKADIAAGGGNKFDNAGDGGINLDEIYNPQFSALADAQRSLEAGKAEDETYVGNQYTTGVNKVKAEEQDQLGVLGKDQETFQNSVKSALAEAVRYYNALQQQARARFGGNSSAGMAVGDLGQQEFLRNQGKINEQEIQGLNKFQQEKNRLATYVKGKLDDLDLFKQDAMRQINQNFRSGLAQLNTQKGMLEGEKAKAKIALLQDTQAKVDSIKLADTQFRQGLAQFSLQQLAAVSGKTFTPEEVADVINGFMNVNLGTGATASRTGTQQKKGILEDEFQTLMV